MYRVRVGGYDSQETAQSLAAELNGRGYSTSVVTDRSGSKPVYRIQVGAFRDEKAAKNSQKELKANGYDAVISKT
jgi:cell division protein FtsN